MAGVIYLLLLGFLGHSLYAGVVYQVHKFIYLDRVIHLTQELCFKALNCSYLFRFVVIFCFTFELVLNIIGKMNENVPFEYLPTVLVFVKGTIRVISSDLYMMTMLDLTLYPCNPNLIRNVVYRRLSWSYSVYFWGFPLKKQEMRNCHFCRETANEIKHVKLTQLFISNSYLIIQSFQWNRCYLCM